MKFIKIILISFISTIMVSASVMQFHHHDSHGNMCLSIFDFHKHTHHNHTESPDHDHNCAAKISIMDCIEKAVVKFPVITELKLLWSSADFNSMQPVVRNLFDFNLLMDEILWYYASPGLGGTSFRAPPVAI